jgi:hypothetical protein
MLLSEGRGVGHRLLDEPSLHDDAGGAVHCRPQWWDNKVLYSRARRKKSSRIAIVRRMENNPWQKPQRDNKNPT